MDNKTSAEVGYLTIIGWLIAYVFGEKPRNEFAVYHFKQAFGVSLLWFLYFLIIGVLGILKVIPFEFRYYYNAPGFLFLILLIIGLVNASGNKQVPVPIFGKMFEKWFSFVK